MTNILGYQKLKICDPHGLGDFIVVKIEKDCLIVYDPTSKSPFNWLKLKEGPDDYGYIFLNLNRNEYNINWNITKIPNLDNNNIGELSLCLFPQDTNPIIIELLEVKDNGLQRTLKMKIFEQLVFNFETNECVQFDPSFTYVKIRFEGDEYIIEDFEDVEE